jgi:hypothetical protein
MNIPSKISIFGLLEQKAVIEHISKEFYSEFYTLNLSSTNDAWVRCFRLLNCDSLLSQYGNCDMGTKFYSISNAYLLHWTYNSINQTTDFVIHCKMHDITDNNNKWSKYAKINRGTVV